MNKRLDFLAPDDDDRLQKHTVKWLYNSVWLI